jgi:hypothetical protein
MRQNLDLFGDVFDAFIKTAPIAAEVLHDPDHTEGQYVDALGQKFRELLTKEPKALTYRNAVLQKKTADLIDHSRPIADQARSHPVQGL